MALGEQRLPGLGAGAGGVEAGAPGGGATGDGGVGTEAALLGDFTAYTSQVGGWSSFGVLSGVPFP